MRVPPGSTVRILDAEAGRAPKGGEGSYFRSEGGGEGLFRGAKPPPNSWPVLGPVRARVRLRRRLRGAFRCPPDRGERERTGHRLPHLSPLPWGGGAKRAPKVPPVFATVGTSTDCTEGAFEHRKGSYPLSHVSYSRRRTGTSRRPQGPLVHPPWLPARSAPPLPASCRDRLLTMRRGTRRKRQARGPRLLWALDITKAVSDLQRVCESSCRSKEW